MSQSDVVALLRHENTQHLEKMFGPVLRHVSLLAEMCQDSKTVTALWSSHGLVVALWFSCFSPSQAPWHHIWLILLKRMLWEPNRAHGLLDFWPFLLRWWYKVDDAVGEELERKRRLRRKITRSQSRCSASKLLIQVATSNGRDQRESHLYSSWRKCACKESIREKRYLYFFRQCSVLKFHLYIKM